ncbi:hypothetical protein ACHAXS_001195 [Conticribra weissflogii]
MELYIPGKFLPNCRQINAHNDADITELIIVQNWQHYQGVDEDISSLGRAIGRNLHLRHIKLRDANTSNAIRLYGHDSDWTPSDVSKRRWKLLADGLIKNQSIRLLHFELCGKNLWEVALYLSLFLENNPSLDEIHFLDNQGMNHDGEGLNLLLSPLLKRSRPLEEINFGNADVNDDVLRVITTVFEENPGRTPKSIEFSPYAQIGRDGFECLARLLELPGCSLQELHLNNEDVDDDVANIFANSLRSNNSLRILSFVREAMISAAGWRVFDTVVCDTESMNATYTSNHTLTSLGNLDSRSNQLINPLSEDLRRYLQLNKNENKRLVARKKVFANYFVSTRACFNTLDGMTSSLLVRVIGFVDKVIAENGEEMLGVGNNFRYNFVYLLLKNNPILLMHNIRYSVWAV